jgi:hypothetical protein
MLPTLRKFLIIVLTILQLFAPLVHAHASESHSNQGFHIPGLEHYSSHHQSTAYIKAHSSLLACVDGVLVGVGLGLKQKLSATPSDTDNSYYVPMHISLLSSVALPLKIYDSGQSQPLLAKLLASPPPSRAPPSA